MAVLGCGFCSYAIRYHGEPEGKYPVEHAFILTRRGQIALRSSNVGRSSRR